jgi:hypothetical protein
MGGVDSNLDFQNRRSDSRKHFVLLGVPTGHETGHDCQQSNFGTMLNLLCLRLGKLKIRVDMLFWA